MIPAGFINVRRRGGTGTFNKQAGNNRQGLCPFHNEKTPLVHRHPDQAVLSLLCRCARARHWLFDGNNDGSRADESARKAKLVHDWHAQANAEKCIPPANRRKTDKIRKTSAKLWKNGKILSRAIAQTSRRSWLSETTRPDRRNRATLRTGFCAGSSEFKQCFADYHQSSSLIDAGLVKQKEDNARRYDFS